MLGLFSFILLWNVVQKIGHLLGTEKMFTIRKDLNLYNCIKNKLLDSFLLFFYYFYIIY